LLPFYLGACHIGRIDRKGLGVLSNDRDLGFFIHPTLVVDGGCGLPLGISHVQLWSRRVEHLDKPEHRYKELPIEEKNRSSGWRRRRGVVVAWMLEVQA
jgi:hypothetical protein